MKKIKVLQMFLGSKDGGRTRYILNTWKYVNKEKFQFDFVTLNKSLDYANELEAEGCQVFYVSCFAEENREQFIKEIDAILSNGYDVVHINASIWKSFTVNERAKLAGIRKIIVHTHNFGAGFAVTPEEAELLEKRHYELREEISSDMADHFLACSQEAADWMYGDIIEKSKVKVIDNGIELKNYKFNEHIRRCVRNREGVNDNYVIGHIGRFANQKNHVFLIDVFSKLYEENTKAVLWLIGVGELQDEIKEKVHKLQIEDRIRFMDTRNDIPELLQAMDLFVLPSLFDGFPLSIIEAQAADLPCVVGNIPKKAAFSNRVYFPEFSVEEWVSIIEKEIQLDSRVVAKHELIGVHDIRNQVRELEKIYCSV